ncbi:MAG: glycosyltransferase [Candidatus Microsaccharimonas sp.]
MKRVALIRNSYSFDVGGAEIFPVNLGKLLVSHSYEPFVLSANKRTLAMSSTAGLNVVSSPWWSFQNFSGVRTLLFPLYLLWQLVLTLWYFLYFLKNHIDVVHPQSRDDFIASTVAAKLLRKRIIWTDHADLKYVYMNHKKWYKNPVGKLVYMVSKLADKIVVESHSEKKLIEVSLNKKLPSNYVVIHLGVVDSYKPSNRERDALVLVSTSRLVKAKGIGELIKAFKLIDSTNVILKLCGDGPDAGYFKSLARGVKNVEFLGHVDDVIQILQNADVLIHPSYHEGFGLSLVEAEMCSLPIIACNVGSIPEIVNDGTSGILVNPRNVKDLASAMTLLVENAKLRVAMGKAGRQIFLDNFQFDIIVEEKFLPLYEGG